MKYLVPFAALFVISLVIWTFLIPQISLDGHDTMYPSNLAGEILDKMTDCGKLNVDEGGWECLKILAKDLHRNYPLSDILAALAIVKNEPHVLDECHTFEHYLGREEYKRTQSVAEAFRQTSSACFGGAAHGIVEGYLMEQQWPEVSEEKITEFALTVCQPILRDFPIADYDTCRHGIGHALMFIAGSDVPHSLKLCDILPHSDDRRRCYAGVFHENQLYSDRSGIHKRILPNTVQVYPCNELEEKYLQMCFQYQIRPLISLEKFNEAIEMCLQIPPIYQTLCFFQIGEDAPIFLDLNAYQQIKAVCDQVYVVTQSSSSFRSSCLKGAVSTLVRESKRMEGVFEFCNLFDEEGGQQNECHDSAAYNFEYYRGVRED